ncbi:cpz-1 [Scenedesmus sp. PABB004]|nr:cpz-1 [Scenedesmus sp. PABB004]
MLPALIFCLLAARGALGATQGGRPSRLHLYPEAEHFYNHVPAPVPDSLPESFNWCGHDGVNYCAPSWNQHIPQYCGSCWVHGTLSMIQDRLKIAKLRAGDLAPDVMLGRQTLLNCAGFHGLGDGCNGGEPLEVFKYMAEHGLPDESCLHYAATDHHVFKKAGYKDCPARGRCMNCMPKGGGDEFACWGIKKPVMYNITAYGKLEPGAEAMQAEILARGPITCGIACPDDFTYAYHSGKRGGVYVDKSGDTELDHDIEVVGWGEEEGGLKYWIARNSWGSYWGELGFFKVERGVNALQIESGDCWYAVPEYETESAVVDGELEGSMWGLRHPKHHPHCDHDDDDASPEERTAAALADDAAEDGAAAAAAAASAIASGVSRLLSGAVVTVELEARPAAAGVEEAEQGEGVSEAAIIEEAAAAALEAGPGAALADARAAAGELAAEVGEAVGAAAAAAAGARLDVRGGAPGGVWAVEVALPRSAAEGVAAAAAGVRAAAGALWAALAAPAELPAAAEPGAEAAAARVLGRRVQPAVAVV